ncbi:hypothetical protein SBOR_9709 [Sclerotinia borealis F-4128]|uniref:Alpha/beta hydrolase fold-3 domain-containing protein n=1 Tax=Sclerotinia borealis (strain F-4128) TaxID=1432307 RepID=W9C1Z7_SCLBF|nr:hypothetical protein SBOR_9709 [Sclerotinia borealis F-4128]
MVLNTVSVGTAVAPVVVQTLIAHYIKRGSRKEKPTAHISYDEGLSLIRKFLIYASHHTVEDIQRFTSQWVPHPPYVKVDEISIPAEYITDAATEITLDLGRHGGIEKVGGREWWQWRRPGSELKAEWIETRADYQERMRSGGESKRVMLYVHGGAYFFGSTDEHRYQMQRHARKLKARVFAPRYRLSPQFPFPCGLFDCLAAYLYLLSVQDPTTIILAGDSAGGGMVLSMLTIMRDSGIPLPAGAILISPWVDLTHSFPSVAEDNPLDYIPAQGFHQRPSRAWPPPNADDMRAIEEGLVNNLVKKERKTSSRQSETDAVQGFRVDSHPPSGTQDNTAAGASHPKGTRVQSIPGSTPDLSVMIDGELVVIKDQIQMYTTNQLIAHPLVSPALQPSLGGLPPLLILTGGGEMLRDEQIYIAHKAANPAQYPSRDAFLDANPHNNARSQISKYKPTDVQLQVWDDLCHVAPTLSFTRPAKYMYRSIAQFGAWALARAQKTEIEILDDDDVSIISKSSDSSEDAKEATPSESTEQVGKAGDPLPPFKNHMIRQRIDRHGNIFPLAPASELPACKMSPAEIGVIKPGPVQKWMAVKKTWDTKYASEKRKVQKNRAKEISKGYETFGPHDVPPPSALAGRRVQGVAVKREEGKKRSWGMSMWSGWGSKHDKLTMDREAEADKYDQKPDTTVTSAEDGAGARDVNDTITEAGRRHPIMMDGELRGSSRERSRRRKVLDENQTEESGADELFDENTPMARYSAMQQAARNSDNFMAERNTTVMHGQLSGTPAPEFDDGGGLNIPEILIRSPTIERNNEEGVERYNSEGEEMRRPTAHGIAFPFAMAMGGEGVDGVMKDGVRQRNARNGVSGRHANASTESLISVRSGLSEGHDWHFDDKEGYVQVKREEGKEEGKGNDFLGVEPETGMDSSSGVESGGEGLSENEGQGGLGLLGGVDRIMKGKGKDVDRGLEPEMEKETETDGKTDVNGVSPCLSAVGGQSRPKIDRFFSAQEVQTEVDEG